MLLGSFASAAANALARGCASHAGALRLATQHAGVLGAVVPQASNLDLPAKRSKGLAARRAASWQTHAHVQRPEPVAPAPAMCAQVRQLFERFTAASPAAAGDARFDVFMRTVWPRAKDAGARGEDGAD